MINDVARQIAPGKKSSRRASAVFHMVVKVVHGLTRTMNLIIIRLAGDCIVKVFKMIGTLIIVFNTGHITLLEL